MNIVDQSGAKEAHVWEAGKAYWLPANPPNTMHADVNAGDKPIEVVVVERRERIDVFRILVQPGGETDRVREFETERADRILRNARAQEAGKLPPPDRVRNVDDPKATASMIQAAIQPSR